MPAHGLSFHVNPVKGNVLCAVDQFGKTEFRLIKTAIVNRTDIANVLPALFKLSSSIVCT